MNDKPIFIATLQQEDDSPFTSFDKHPHHPVVPESNAAGAIIILLCIVIFVGWRFRNRKNK